MEAVTVVLPGCKLQELLELLDIPVMQRRMGRKDI